MTLVRYWKKEIYHFLLSQYLDGHADSTVQKYIWVRHWKTGSSDQKDRLIFARLNYQIQISTRNGYSNM